MASATVEDYIKHIYMAAEQGGGASVPMGRIAEALGVVPGTTTTMVKALADAGLVDYEPRVGVTLTAAGTKLALHVLRRHRLIEQFLVEVLGFDWSEVHPEAERLEHAVSDLLLERIDRLLGHPTRDPHGDPIPSAEGVLDGGRTSTLADCALGEPMVVERIRDQDSGFLNFVSGAGLNPGAAVRVDERNAASELVVLAFPGRTEPVAVGMAAAGKVEVRRVREDPGAPPSQRTG